MNPEDESRPAESVAERLSDSPWGTHSLSPGAAISVAVGWARLWMKSRPGEVVIAVEMANDISSSGARPDACAPDGLQWRRWAWAEQHRRVVLQPLLPDRSVVVGLETPIVLPARCRIRIFVKCPLWIRVRSDGESPRDLLEAPSQELSRTWFGAYHAGELCYWVASAADRELEAGPDPPWLAVCPLEIENSAREDLAIEKLCLRVDNLPLFADKGRIWASETRIRHRGKKGHSEIDSNGLPPPEASGAPLVSPSRDSSLRSFAARTFSRLKGLPGFGFID